jgi:anti-sigma-K factor RskA
VNTHDQFAEDVLLYALGSLDENERQRVEAHLRECAECRRELQAAQEDLGLLALSTTGPKPPARSRERFLSAIEKEPRPARRAENVGKGWMWIPWFTTLAFALLAALLYFANLRIKNDVAALRSNSQAQEIELRQSREMLELLKSPDAVRVTLTTGKEKPQPQGKTIYSPEKGRLIFMASNLPAAPANKAYELWLVPKQGAPVPAGTFWPDAGGNATVLQNSMPSGMQPKAFAVTIEKAEGSATPTMPMVLVGSAGD